MTLYGNHLCTFYTLNDLGQAYRAAGEREKALAMFQQAQNS
jgi:Tetratricopeptide repeat